MILLSRNYKKLSRFGTLNAYDSCDILIMRKVKRKLIDWLYL